MPLANYQVLRANIKDGDVLLFNRDGSFLSNLISRVQGCRHTHVALAKWRGARLKTCEFREFNGYEERFVSELGDFDHVATNFNWSNKTDQFINLAKKQGYSYFKALIAALPIPFFGRGYICSEFVAKAFEGQINLPSHPTPGDIADWLWRNDFPIIKVKNEGHRRWWLGPNGQSKVLLNLMEEPMSLPDHFTKAKTYEDVKELPGRKRNNPQILEFYNSVGRGEVSNDEVPWCAAFVGHCLVKSGYKPSSKTQQLLARSYSAYGDPVHLNGAKAGDICVFKRGKKGWQGHVGFFVKQTKNYIYLLGGNQGNAVNVRKFSKNSLLAIRRPNAACLIEEQTKVIIDTTPEETVELGRKLSKKPKWKSRTIWSGVTTLFGTLYMLFNDLVRIILHIVDVMTQPVLKLQQLISSFEPSTKTMGALLIIISTSVLFYAYADDSQDLDDILTGDADANNNS